MRLVAALVVILLAACDQGEKKSAPPPPPPAAPAPIEQHTPLDAEIVKVREAELVLGPKIDHAVDVVVAAETDRSRADAKATLMDLQRQRAELESRLAALEAQAAKLRRVVISQDCLDNPLAKGCQ